MKRDRVGQIYVMRSGSLPAGWYKIGASKKPEERARQLGGTSSFSPFVVVRSWHTDDMWEAERLLFLHLANYRTMPNREFFDAPLRRVVTVAREVLGYVNHGVTPRPEKLFNDRDLDNID